MIEIEGLTRIYAAEDVETTALALASLSIGAGEFVAVMGPSGCGKSTLLNQLGCLDRPSGGSYRLLGTEVTRLSDAERTRLRRRHIGFVFQNSSLIDDLSVTENVEIGLLYRPGLRDRRARVPRLLETVGIAHRAGHRPRALSGGQQQRAAIARALAGGPDLILADEPAGNLDSFNGDSVVELLADIARGGTTVVMVTHSRRHAAAAGRIVQMLDGRIVEETRL
jgi:putative ABC transport system ATP-binding protein